MKDEPKKPGRPKGSRSKTTLMKAQLLVDDFSIEAVENMIALANNDSEDKLKMKGKVPATIVLAANSKILDKALANEKEKLDEKPEKVQPIVVTEAVTEDSVVPIGPKVFSSAKKK